MTTVLFIKSGGNILYALSTYVNLSLPVKQTQGFKTNLNKKNLVLSQRIQNRP